MKKALFKKAIVGEFARRIYFSGSRLVAHTVKKSLHFIETSTFQDQRVEGTKEWLVSCAYRGHSLVGTKSGEIWRIAVDHPPELYARLSEPIWIGAIAEGADGDVYVFAGLNILRFRATGEIVWTRDSMIPVKHLHFESTKGLLWCVGDGIVVFDTTGSSKTVVDEASARTFSSVSSNGAGLVACCDVEILVFAPDTTLMGSTAGPYVHIAFTGERSICASAGLSEVDDQVIELVDGTKIDVQCSRATSAIAYNSENDLFAMVHEDAIEFYK